MSASIPFARRAQPPAGQGGLLHFYLVDAPAEKPAAGAVALCGHVRPTVTPENSDGPRCVVCLDLLDAIELEGV